jgi:hypothetical protein
LLITVEVSLKSKTGIIPTLDSVFSNTCFFLTPTSLIGAYIDPTFYLSKAVCNIISSIVFGDRFDYEDEEFLSLLKRMLGLMQFMSSSAGQVIYPSLTLPGSYQKLTA